MPSTLIDPTLEGVARALTVHARRHGVLAENVANLETPGFHARDTDFRRALEAAFSTARAGEAAPDVETVREDTSVPPRADGNTVDLDLQMAQLSDNASRYGTLSRILAKRLALIRHGIEGAR